MKHNAILRIILWSVVIVLLLGILGSVLLGSAVFQMYKSSSVSVTQIMETEKVNNIQPPDETTRVPKNTEASTPAQVNTQDDVTTVPAAGIRELEINWVSGNILIQSGDVAEIQISESGVTDADYVMQVRQKEEKLSIAFTQGTQSFLGLGIHGELSKDLTVVVPASWACEDLEIDVASAKVEIQGLTIRDLEFNGASGECNFTDCTVDSLDVNTASGDVYFTGRLRDFDCEAASASVYAKLSNVPEEMDLETMSGLMDITLPEDAGFTVSMESMKASFSSEFDTTTQGNRYVCGNGQCKISVESMSGEVILRKG